MRNGLLAWLVLALVPSAHAETNSLSFRSVLFVKCFRLWGADLIWQMAGIDLHVESTG